MCCECVDWLRLFSDREESQQWTCYFYRMWKLSSLLIDTICFLLHLYRELQNILYTYPYNKNKQDADCTDISGFTVNITLKKYLHTSESNL